MQKEASVKHIKHLGGLTEFSHAFASFYSTFKYFIFLKLWKYITITL